MINWMGSHIGCWQLSASWGSSSSPSASSAQSNGRLFRVCLCLVMKMSEFKRRLQWKV